ncbi:MAG: hypothetical protein AB1782_17400 [Cyanobacteriota bacterium]
MKKTILPMLAIIFAFIQPSSAEEISRLEIQNLFNKTPGNASYLPFWEKKYLNKRVTWKGSIFSIQYQKDFNRTEITLKVLPATIMYDTVVYIPGDISDKFKLKEEVSFSGNISRGVDMLGVKEVQVNIGNNLNDRFGDYVFSDSGIVNVNFLNDSKQEQPLPEE